MNIDEISNMHKPAEKMLDNQKKASVKQQIDAHFEAKPSTAAPLKPKRAPLLNTIMDKAIIATPPPKHT